MTPEERRMLEEVHALATENAKILKSMQRSTRLGAVFKVLYWIVIIALSFGAYYLIQPYIDTLKGSLNDLQGMAGTANSSVSSSSFGDALKNLQELQKLYKN